MNSAVVLAVKDALGCSFVLPAPGVGVARARAIWGVVPHDGGRHAPKLEPQGDDPPGEIKILVIHKEGLVEAADIPQSRAADIHPVAPDEVDG